jgi:CubicO group peptidase (beta-lactamase class C family)
MVARAHARRDALDEAGLVRRGRAEPIRPLVPLPASPALPPPDEWKSLAASPLEVDPDEAGMNRAALDALDRVILGGLADSVASGAALAVGRGDRLVRLRGYGRLDWDPGSLPVTPFTIFDLASLTKVIGTTSAVMVLVDEGRLDLDDPVVRHLPEWSRGDPRKDRVTVRDLLLHRSGLPAFRRFFLELEGEDEIRAAVYDLPLDREPGRSTVYSDIGFKTLAWVVESVVGERLDRFLERRVFAPLGMEDTRFLPDPEHRRRVAPTEWDRERRGYHIHGEVHDENAHALGGVAGHAGLFSTAQDLAVFAAMMAGEGRIGACVHEEGGGAPCGARTRPSAVELLAPGTVAAFTSRADPDESRALGWDTPSERSSAGAYFSIRSFGHTGFTGTSIWVDPELDVWVVLLTHRVNPTRDNARHIPFRRAVHDAVAAAIRDRPVELREER